MSDYSSHGTRCVIFCGHNTAYLDALPEKACGNPDDNGKTGYSVWRLGPVWKGAASAMAGLCLGKSGCRCWERRLPCHMCLLSPFWMVESLSDFLPSLQPIVRAKFWIESTQRKPLFSEKSV